MEVTFSLRLKDIFIVRLKIFVDALFKIKTTELSLKILLNCKVYEAELIEIKPRKLMVKFNFLV